MCPLDELPEVPDYGNPLPALWVDILAANKTFISGGFGPSEPTATKDGKAVIFAVYGRITYFDLSGKECHTGFGVDCSPHMNATTTLKNQAYTYYD